jgi:hypothetical protein
MPFTTDKSVAKAEYWIASDHMIVCLQRSKAREFCNLLAGFLPVLKALVYYTRSFLHDPRNIDYGPGSLQSPGKPRLRS